MTFVIMMGRSLAMGLISGVTMQVFRKNTAIVMPLLMVYLLFAKRCYEDYVVIKQHEDFANVVFVSNHGETFFWIVCTGVDIWYPYHTAVDFSLWFALATLFVYWRGFSRIVGAHRT